MIETRSGFRRTAVKICGIRRADDALVAERAGADYLGFVFADGPRRVDAGTAAEIVQAVGIPAVGVFVDRGAEEILEIRALAGIQVAQLHGAEAPEACRLLRSEGIQVWKALRPRARGELARLARRYERVADALLVEGFAPGAGGGAGAAFPHQWLGALSRDERGPRLVLAGGLTPTSVADAIRTVRPDVVDVSSGVESRPGEKDPELVRAFIRNARAAVDGEDGG